MIDAFRPCRLKSTIFESSATTADPSRSIGLIARSPWPARVRLSVSHVFPCPGRTRPHQPVPSGPASAGQHRNRIAKQTHAVVENHLLRWETSLRASPRIRSVELSGEFKWSAVEYAPLMLCTTIRLPSRLASPSTFSRCNLLCEGSSITSTDASWN